MSDTQERPVSPLAARLGYYCDCETPGDGCCDFSEAAAIIEAHFNPRPVSQLVKFPATRMTLEQAKKEHDEWHPVYIEDCLWCRSEVALPSVRAALQASEEREQRLRALCKNTSSKDGIAPLYWQGLDQTRLDAAARLTREELFGILLDVKPHDAGGEPVVTLHLALLRRILAEIAIWPDEQRAINGGNP